MASTFFRKERKKTALFPGARGSSTTRAQAFPFAGVLMVLISFPQLSSPLAPRPVSNRTASEAELLWCDLIMFLKGPDQMAAVRETSLGGDIVQVVIGEKQEIFHLVQPDELDILLAALP